MERLSPPGLTKNRRFGKVDLTTQCGELPYPDALATLAPLLQTVCQT